MDQKKKELTDRFEMTDMGEVKRILGIDVQRDYEQGTLAISQEHYVNTLLERFGMQEANPVSTPGYGAEISTNQPQDQILGSTDKKNLPVDDGKHPLPGPVHAIRPLLRCPTTFQGLQQPGAGEHDSSQARSSIPSG